MNTLTEELTVNATDDRGAANIDMLNNGYQAARPIRAGAGKSMTNLARPSCTVLAMLILNMACGTIARPSSGNSDTTTVLEQQTSCLHRAWIFKEPRVLRSWAWIAEGHNDPKLEAYIQQMQDAGALEPVTVATGDGRSLQGWRLSAPGAISKTAVLVGVGNVATADLVVQRLEPLTRRISFDFFVLDYRGYARSKPGYPAFRAFVQDETDIRAMLRQRGYEKVIGYGMSFGGIVLLNSIGRGMELDRIIVDSVPSDLRAYDCDADLYPINALPKACPSVVALTSKNDRVVFPKEQREFLSRVAAPACGGRVVELQTAIHSFDDKPGSPGDLERLSAIADLLALP